MSKFNNSRKESFLKTIPCISIDDHENDLTIRSKFNFSYFDESQAAGQKFSEWSDEQLSKLLDKLKEYCKQPLKHWNNQKLGDGEHRHNVLEIYGNFPSKSEFDIPKHVPHQALWSRFRLESKVRLIGFVIPEEYHKQPHSKTNELFDCNTFYVVFLDKNHKFYLTEKD
jgi:hypothetical protein